MPIQILSTPDTAADTGQLASTATLHEKAVHALRQVMDPELPLNIYDLGLIYGLELDETTRTALLTMTLTAPNCPVAEELPKQAQAAVVKTTGYEVEVKLTFDPPWNRENLPIEAKLALGIL
ncbi:MAG: iron-sulfur cluster assembly protein [Pseudomonadota bacterium]|jgi:metal-sulfur cluster biosynthetic enzyme